MWKLCLMLMACHMEPPLRIPTFDEAFSESISEALNTLGETQIHSLVKDVTCAQCHPRQAQEYARSTMRYGFFSPSFNALELSLNHLSNGAFTTHGSRGAFCSECHGPAAIFEGLEVNGEQSSRSQLSPLAAREGGIRCDVCHSLHTRREVAQGIKPTPSRDKLTVNEDLSLNSFHSYRTPSQQKDLGLLLTSSDFCAPCHDVRPQISDVVTDKDHIRSEDLFSEWKRSPWAQADHPLNPLRGQTGISGVHDDLEMIAKGEQVSCQDCHMSLYPQRRFNDEIKYDEYYTGVAKESLTRKAHKLYPIGQSAENGSLQNDKMKKRRVSTHYFTGVSHPLTPYPSSSIFALDALNLSLAEQGNEALTMTLSESEDRSRDLERFSSSEWNDQRLISEEQWSLAWRAWREEESGLVDIYGGSLAMHERRKAMLQAALTLDLSETPTSIARQDILSIDAWIENVGAGHRVPAGFSQEREVWVSVELSDQGRICTEHSECSDLIEPPRFVDTANRDCSVHTRLGEIDDALPSQGSWEDAARAERSALCSDQGRCILYRSGYLKDIDGDGRLNDEDLRHSLIERDQDTFDERCVVPGPDADMRLRGVERGLVHFTNSLQRVAVNSRNQAIEHPNVLLLKPTAIPYDPIPTVESIFSQDPRERRSLYPTQLALYEQSRYRPAQYGDLGVMRQGVGLAAPTLLNANRAFNGHSLAPFKPRLARYDVKIPNEARGPLALEVKVRFRFFSPRLLRTLAARHPNLIRETMIDEALEIIELTQKNMNIVVR